MPVQGVDVPCPCGCLIGMKYWVSDEPYSRITLPSDKKLTVKALCLEHLKQWEKSDGSMDFLDWFRTMVMLSDEERFLKALKE